MNKNPKKLTDSLKKRKAEGSTRGLFDGAGLVDFSSNDYLGFSREPPFDPSMQSERPLGATGSRLLTGHSTVHENLENQLSKFYRASAALVFNSGYDANLGLLSALPQKGDVVFYDQWAHASIRDGLRLSEARSFKYKHNNLLELEELALRWRAKSKGDFYVVTESVFSMDGDSPELPELVDLCERIGMYLILDEAHGTFSGQGRGLAHELGLSDRIFARLFTFGKALGSHGAAVVGTEELKIYLLNFARSMIYTTALPPHQLSVLSLAHRIREKSEGMERARQLNNVIEYFKLKVSQLSFQEEFGLNNSPIQWYRFPGNQAVTHLSVALREEGLDVRAIRSPTVPAGSERLRLCLHSYNSKTEIDHLLRILAENTTP